MTLSLSRLLVQGEHFVDTKKRLQARTGTSDKDFAKMKFSMIQNAHYSKPSPLKDGPSSFFFAFLVGPLTDPDSFAPAEDVLFDHKWIDDDFIGLDHVDRRKGPAERGVYIK